MFTLDEGWGDGPYFARDAIRDMATVIENWNIRLLSGDGGVNEAYEAFKANQRSRAEDIMVHAAGCTLWLREKHQAKLAIDREERRARKEA